jgi:hypothetical protein
MLVCLASFGQQKGAKGLASNCAEIEGKIRRQDRSAANIRRHKEATIEGHLFHACFFCLRQIKPRRSSFGDAF